MRLDAQQKTEDIWAWFVAAQGEAKHVKEYAGQWKDLLGHKGNDQAAFDAKFGGGI